jgi:asparagine synthase (glutamine-hydrolysing)
MIKQHSMNKILLVNNNGFSWYSSGSLFVKGYLYSPEDKYYAGKDLLAYFNGIKSFVDLEERVKYANGCFSIVDEVDGILFAASDIARSTPLFYTNVDGWIISDDPYLLFKQMTGAKLNNMAAYEYLASGFVTGRETLIKGINSLQAGEIVRFEGKEIKQKFYFSYRTSRVNDDDYNEIRKSAVQYIEEAMVRFIATLDGRTVIVPLSGGYSSRLLLTLLRKYDYKNVVCFTYGRSDNREMKVASRVAGILKYPWIKIDYSDEMIRNFMDEDFINYYKYAGHLSSSFSLQDYFAARYLKKNKLVPDDSIVASAHAGNFLGGSQLYKHGNILPEEELRKIAKRIYYIKYSLKRPGRAMRKKIMDRIERSLQEKFTGEKSYAFSVHEDWDFKEKLAKLNFNSINSYTYFGYEFRFPFWDRNLVEFFRNLPLETRLNKYLFDDILANEYFDPYGLNFNIEIEPDAKSIRQERMKNKIKYYLPEVFNRLYMRIRGKDAVFYKEITDYLVEDMLKDGIKIRVYGHAYSSLIVQWYLNKTIHWIEREQDAKKI